MLVLNIGTNVSVSIRQAGRLKAPRQRFLRSQVPELELQTGSLERQFSNLQIKAIQGHTRSYKVKKQVIQA